MGRILLIISKRANFVDLTVRRIVFLGPESILPLSPDFSEINKLGTELVSELV